MALDIDRLTLGEVATIEKLSGQSIATVGEDAAPKGNLLAALAFVTKRREQLAAGQPPTFTFNDALGLTFDEAQTLIGLDDDEDEDGDSEDDPEDSPLPVPAKTSSAPAKRTSRSSS